MNFNARRKEKIFYDRSTNSAAICAIQQISFKHPLPLYATQIIKPLLNSKISANHDKLGILANLEILITLNVHLV